MTKTHGHIGVFCLFPCHSLMCARAPQPSGWNLRHYLPPWALRLPVMIPGAIPGCSLNSPALMHGPVIWIKIHEEFLTKMIGRWSQTTVEAPRLFLPGNPAADVSDFFFGWGIDSGEQPVMLHWRTRSGCLVFHNQLPSRFIFWKRRKVVVILLLWI